MPRISLRDFSRGLWLNGARDTIPDGSLRRATGAGVIREGLLRSARGQRLASVAGAHSITKLEELIYQGEGNNLLRNAIVIDPSQDGSRLSFLRFPPQSELDDYLFVAGGGNLIKSDPAGNVSKWGIEPPPDGFNAVAAAARTQVIDSFDSSAAWTMDVGLPTPSDEATLKVEGSGSTQIDTTNGVEISTFYKVLSGNDLNQFFTSPGWSADQDYIEFHFRTQNPDAIDRLELTFGIDLTPGADNNMFTRSIKMEDFVISDEPANTIRGVGDDIPNLDAEQDFIGAHGKRFVHQGGHLVEVPNNFIEPQPLVEKLARTSLSRLANTWLRIRLPKTTFDRVGSDPTRDWSNVVYARFTIVTDGTATTNYFDQFRLYGGTGMIGTYILAVTYKNSITGSRSNPTETEVKVEGVDRTAITWGNIPASIDPQVDTVELWRSLGNGAGLFKIAEIPNGTTTYTDEIADYFGLFSGKHIPESELPDVVTNEAIQFDNSVPLATFEHVSATSFAGRIWWTGDGTGRAYYSGIARPESQADFIEVSNTDDHTVMSIVWNDVLYVFTEAAVYRVTGQNEPFVPELVYGTPGTTHAHAVTATPYGIIYQSHDGLRLFNGTVSELIGFEPLAPVLRGETVETVTPFVGDVATYGRDEYWVGDGTQVLALNPRNQTWRRLAIAATALYAEGDSNEILAGTSTQILALDDDAPALPLTFEIQTPTARSAVDVKGYLQRLFIDVDTQDEQLTLTLLVDDDEIPLPLVVTPLRTTLEYNLLQPGRYFAVRLAGSLSSVVAVYSIEFDLYVPTIQEIQRAQAA